MAEDAPSPPPARGWWGRVFALCGRLLVAWQRFVSAWGGTTRSARREGPLPRANAGRRRGVGPEGRREGRRWHFNCASDALNAEFIKNRPQSPKVGVSALTAIGNAYFVMSAVHTKEDWKTTIKACEASLDARLPVGSIPRALLEG
jgi:hypothetical protein